MRKSVVLSQPLCELDERGLDVEGAVAEGC